jgi:hypothetical protein
LIPLLAGFFVAGCESNNPANIYAERHDLPTPVPEAPRVEVARPEPVVPVVVEEKREPAFQMRPATLVSSNPDFEVAGATRPDLLAMRSSGEVVLKSNDSAFLSQSPMLFDGDLQSLAKSESINPVFLEFEFQKPIRLKAVRMLFSHTVSHNWAVHTDPKKDGMMVRDAPDQQWSRMDFSPPESTQWVRIEMLRTSGDDFVHLNEIEFYVEN